MEKWEIGTIVFLLHILLDLENNNYVYFSVYFSETMCMYMCIINFIIPSHTKTLRLNQTIN